MQLGCVSMMHSFCNRTPLNTTAPQHFTRVSGPQPPLTSLHIYTQRPPPATYDNPTCADHQADSTAQECDFQHWHTAPCELHQQRSH